MRGLTTGRCATTVERDRGVEAVGGLFVDDGSDGEMG